MPDGSWELDSTSVLGALDAFESRAAEKLVTRLSTGYTKQNISTIVRTESKHLLIEQSAVSVLFQYRGASLRSESMIYSSGTPTRDGGGNGLGTKEWIDSVG
jgi:hypothetical protein